MAYCGDLTWSARDAAAHVEPTTETLSGYVTQYTFLRVVAGPEVFRGSGEGYILVGNIEPNFEYPAVDRYPAAGNTDWWRISLPSCTKGWVSASNVPINNESDLRRASSSPPTGLRYTIPDEETLRLQRKAPASSGSTRYQNRSHHVPAPPQTVVTDTESSATQWTVEGRLPSYAHLYNEVAAIRGNAIGQFSSTLTVPAGHCEDKVWGHGGGASAGSSGHRPDCGDQSAAWGTPVLFPLAAAWRRGKMGGRARDGPARDLRGLLSQGVQAVRGRGPHG